MAHLCQGPHWRKAGDNFGFGIGAGNSVADKITSVSGVNAVLAALWSRDRTGKGQKVVVNMIDAWASFILHDEMRNHFFMDSDAPAPPRSGAHRAFKARDGYVTALVIQDSQFHGYLTHRY